jgi:hypothetical protein
MHSIDWQLVGRLGSLHGFALRAFKNELGVQAPVGCWDVGRLVSLHGFALRAFKNELGVQAPVGRWDPAGCPHIGVL